MILLALNKWDVKSVLHMAGSTSPDSINLRSKILQKKIPQSPKKQNFNVLYTSNCLNTPSHRLLWGTQIYNRPGTSRTQIKRFPTSSSPRCFYFLSVIHCSEFSTFIFLLKETAVVICSKSSSPMRLFMLNYRIVWLLCDYLCWWPVFLVVIVAFFP